MSDQSYTWDRSSLRFRDLQSGKFVSERVVRDLVDQVADLASRRMGEAAARYRAGQITITDFQAEMLATIKDSQVAAALLASGGRVNMDPARWGFTGQQIRQQYAYARQMIADVIDGKQRQNGRLDARARQYGGAARQTYNAVRAREAAVSGQRWEKNVMGAAEHCRMCLDQTALGQVPIGSLVPPGQRTCRASCRCHLVYGKTIDVREAA